MKKILITGHKGFVGKHFVKHIHNRYPEATITGCDIKDSLLYDCRNLFKDDTTVYDLVIHLAAIVGGRQTIENDPLAVATDLSIDSEMFNWAVKTKQKKIVYFSSSAAYPITLQTEDKKHKLKESDINLLDIKTPDFSYGWSKLTGEMLANYAKNNYGLNVYVFRPFSGFGFDQDLDYPFPSFLNRVINKVDKFQIWGDGTQVRDFIYIDDVIKGVFKTVELNIQNPVNLGTGRPVSFTELANIMFNIYNYHPKNDIDYLLDKPKGVMYRCSDNSLFKSYYSFDNELEDILREHKNVYNSL